MFGEELRRQREAKGRGLDDIVRVSRIPLRILTAIEEERISDLGPAVFVRGHLRTLCSIYGIDPAPILEDFNAHAGQNDIDLNTSLRQPDPLLSADDAGISPLIVALVMLMLVVAGGAWWYFGTGEAPQSAPTPAAQLTEETPEPSGAEAAPVDAAPVEVLPPMEEPAVVPPTVKEEPEGPPAEAELVPEAPAEAAPAEVEEPEPVPAPEPEPLELELIGLGKAWVGYRLDEAQTGDFMLQEGTRKNLTAQEVIELKLGSAGAVRLRLNGREHPSPGRVGQVRTLKIDRQTLQSLESEDEPPRE